MPERRPGRHLVPDDEREDRTGQAHPEPDPEGQQQDEDRARDGEPEQAEPDDQPGAGRQRVAGPEPAGQRRRERREDAHAQDRDRAERAGDPVRDAQAALDARQQRADGDDLDAEDQGDRHQRDERPRERPNRSPSVTDAIRLDRARSARLGPVDVRDELAFTDPDQDGLDALRALGGALAMDEPARDQDEVAGLGLASDPGRPGRIPRSPIPTRRRCTCRGRGGRASR